MSAPRIITLAQLAQARPERGAAVIAVPGEHVSALSCQIPPNLRGKNAQNVALQAVQDAVASPLSETGLIVLPGTGPARTVLACAQAKLAEWAALRARHNQRAARVLPDYLCLPWQEGTLSLSAPDAGRLIVRTGALSGFSGAPGLVIQMLGLLRRQGHDVTALTLAQPEARALPELSAELSAWGVPAHTATQAANPPQGSLLPGAGQALGLSPRMQAWGVTAGAGLIAALLWAANTQSELTALNRQTVQLRQANLDFARQELGLSGPVVDLRLQVERALTALKTAAQDSSAQMGLPEFLRLAGPVLAAQGVTVTQLRYGAQVLSLSVETPDFAQLERLRIALQSAGVSAQILRSVGSGAGGVQAELRLTPEDGG
jgi:type II secretion system protein L